MGAGLTRDSVLPPWTLGPEFDNARFSFLKDDLYWSMVHFMFPFTIYLYCRSFNLVMFFVVLNEIIERVLETSGSQGSTFVQGLQETPNDIMWDILNGAIACWVGNWFCAAFDCGFHQIPSRFLFRDGTFHLVFKYVIQILILAAGWIGVPWLYIIDSNGKGHYSLGVTINLFWYPIMLYIFQYYWNADDPYFVHLNHPNWFKTTGSGKPITELDVHDSYAKYNQQGTQWFCLGAEWFSFGPRHSMPHEHYHLFINYWIGFYVLFQLSMFYRYTHVTVQVLIHQALTLIILFIIILFGSHVKHRLFIQRLFYLVSNRMNS